MSRVPRGATGLLLLAVVGACTADRPSEAPHREMIGAVSPPGDQWSARPREIATVLGSGDGGALREVDGVWGGPVVGYGVSWRVRVEPDDEERRCEEAAQWLVDTSAKLPGEPVAGFATAPAQARVRERCLGVLEGEGDAEGSGSDTFATTRNTRWEDLQYGGWLTFERSGGDRLLWAGLVADRHQ